jgi:hypothetical protein
MRSCEEATVFSCFYYKKNSAKLSSPKLRRLHCDGADDDDPFIVLTETKFSFRCIPVWIGTLLTGLGPKKKTHVIMFSP